MNVVFLSPHFPPNFYNFCVALRKNGVTTLGVGDCAREALRPELGAALTDYYRVSDMHRYSELEAALRYFTARYGRIDRLDSLNEYWLETEAKLRTEFSIFGVTEETIASIRRKSMMKILFRSCGVDAAPGMLVTTEDKAREFIKEAGYPVIVKPDGGVGAADTWRLDNELDLTAFFTKRPSAEYYMEQFIEGVMYTFDGLTDRDGRLLFWTSHTYSQGIMETVNNDLDVSYYSLREIPQDLETAGRKLLSAFDVRERFFHFEFFRTPSGGLKALEVNMRPPGGLTTDMFNYACDIDVYDLWARTVAGSRTAFDFKRKYHCCYVSRKSNRRYAYSHDEIVRKLRGGLVHHERIQSIFGRALGDHGFLFRAGNLDEVLAAVRLIQQKA